MDFHAFIQKWAASSSAERANAQPFLTDLCDVLGVEKPRPTTGNPDNDHYVFEHDALISHPGGRVSVGKIDLFRPPGFRQKISGRGGYGRCSAPVSARAGL